MVIIIMFLESGWPSSLNVQLSTVVSLQSRISVWTIRHCYKLMLLKVNYVNLYLITELYQILLCLFRLNLKLSFQGKQTTTCLIKRISILYGFLGLRKTNRMVLVYQSWRTPYFPIYLVDYDQQRLSRPLLLP